MSYTQPRAGYYEMFQPDSPWAPGAPGWSKAPVPMWGNNPNLRGPRMLATHGFGEDSASKPATAVAALLFAAVAVGVVIWGASKIGQQSYAANSSGVPVMFRKERRKNGQVVAVFPTSRSGGGVEIYTLEEGGGTADLAWVWNQTRPAKPEEYARLREHIETGPGATKLRVVQRSPRR